MQFQSFENRVLEYISIWNPFWDMEGVLTPDYAKYLYSRFQKKKALPEAYLTITFIRDNLGLALTSPNNFIRTLAELIQRDS